MATREAGVRLTLQNQGFKRGMADVEADTKRRASSMGNALRSSLSDGAKGGLNALKSAFSAVKSTIFTLGGLTGAIGVGALIRGAITMESKYRQLAFAIKAGTGASVDFRTIQKDVEATALKTGQTAEDLAGVFGAVFQETGNAEFARDTLKSIATAATATHAPVEQIGAIAGTLNEKFGIAAGEIDSALATVIGLGNKGGISIADMGERLGQVGAIAKEAGLEGRDGFEKIVGMMNLADNATGNLRKGISAVQGLFTELGDKTSRTKVAQALGISPAALKGDATKMIETILAKTKGDKDKLAKAFTGETLKLIVDLGKQGDLKAALADASKSAISFAEIQAEAAKEMETADKKFQTALEKMKQAFSKPEITEALTKLADVLPAFADMMASVVGFAAKSPVAAGTLGVAGYVGASAASAGLQTLLLSALGLGGAKAGTAIQGAMGKGGEAASTSIGGVLAKGGLSIGGAIAIALASVAVGAAIRQALDAYRKQKTEKDLEEIDKAGGEAVNAAGDEFKTYRRNPETGELEARTSKVRTLKGGRLLNFANKIKADMETEDPNAFREGFYGPGGKQAPAPKPGMPAENARLLADMLGQKELRVKVVNPAEIGVGGSPLDKPPVPGFVGGAG